MSAGVEGSVTGAVSPAPVDGDDASEPVSVLVACGAEALSL
jgi:hypothetical protein